MSNFISYHNLLNDREQFRKAGGKYGSDFNIYDTPGHKYFKLFFYFNNGDVDNQLGISAGNGLLAPTWLQDPNYLTEQYLYLYNSAWSYLKMNAEDERADMLIDFVNTLSNISSESPWYFSEVSGLDSAMERKQINADNFAIEATRQKISIKCLPDAYDDRIGTLLDLYRAITWSWLTKREVLPANLRKFDMGIFIYETPYAILHEESGIGGTNQHDRVSYKYIELHNCEIDYSSSKTLTSALNNKEGFNPEYNIEIFFDDCYEIRYNEFMMKEIGDMILFDLDEDNEYEPSSTASKKAKKKKGFLVNATEQLIETGKDVLNSIYKRAVLGNLYTFSLTRLSDQWDALKSGDVLSSARAVAEYIRDFKQRSSNNLSNLNLFEKVGITQQEKTFNTVNQIGSIKGEVNSHYTDTNDDRIGTTATKKRIIPKVKYIGNLYKGNTIADNL